MPPSIRSLLEFLLAPNPDDRCPSALEAENRILGILLHDFGGVEPDRLTAFVDRVMAKELIRKDLLIRDAMEKQPSAAPTVQPLASQPPPQHVHVQVSLDGQKASAPMYQRGRDLAFADQQSTASTFNINRDSSIRPKGYSPDHIHPRTLSGSPRLLYKPKLSKARRRIALLGKMIGMGLLLIVIGITFPRILHMLNILRHELLDPNERMNESEFPSEAPRGR
jgi:hypothetical protein